MKKFLTLILEKKRILLTSSNDLIQCQSICFYLMKVTSREKKRGLEHLIKNKVEFALKFEPAQKAFYQLVFKEIENRVSYLKSQLCPIQNQSAHQERIFARIEIRRQGRELLTCEYKNRLGCFGDDQCDNCQVNYSINADNQITEITK